MDLTQLQAMQSMASDPVLMMQKLRSVAPKAITEVELKTREDRELMKTCKEFEAIFVGMLYKSMKKTVPEDSFIEKSNGTRIFEDMYMDELAKVSSETQGFGIAGMLYDQFKMTNKKAVSPEDINK